MPYSQFKPLKYFETRALQDAVQCCFGNGGAVVQQCFLTFGAHGVKRKTAAASNLSLFVYPRLDSVCLPGEPLHPEKTRRGVLPSVFLLGTLH